MLYLDGFVGIALLALWIFCIIDVLMTDPALVRNLPKVGWVLIVLFFPEIGSVAWLLAGRPWHDMPNGMNRNIPPTRGYPEYERLGRSTAANPEADAEFLRQCRERAEEQRLRYQQQKKDEG